MGSLSIWIDESERGDYLAVGGAVIAWDAVPRVVSRWRSLKTSFGLDPAGEVKWSLPSGHLTRKALEEKDRTTRSLCEAAAEFIGQSQEMVCAVAVMRETRERERWKIRWAKASVRDFYCEGLKYVLQRVAEEVEEQGKADCVVVCDTPELGTKPFNLGTISRGSRAAQENYKDWYKRGVNVGPGRQHSNKPLQSILFHPSILVGDATYHDMLQIADVVVGVTIDWVNAVSKGSLQSWETEGFKKVRPRFRQRYGQPDFFGDGLIVWPKENDLWAQLQTSLK